MVRTVPTYVRNVPRYGPKCITLILRRVVYVYTMKIKGPRTQPCMGTPQEEVFEEDI